MSRYIDEISARENFQDVLAYMGSEVKRILKKVPTADVVEVVRCKDCAHYHEVEGFEYKGRKARHCMWHSALRYENDYCSDGIRREKCEIG